MADSHDAGAAYGDGTRCTGSPLAARGLEGALTVIARSVAVTAGGDTVAAIELTPRGQRLASVGSDAVARALNGAQYGCGEGPALDGGAAGVRYVPELDEAGPWPRFAVPAAALGIRSLLTLPLNEPDGTVAGLLTLYVGRVAPFDGPARARLCVLARHVSAVIAVLLQRTVFPCGGGADPYGEVAGRILVEQAIGVLMARHRCDPGTARALLHEEARRRGVALHVTATGVLAEDDRPSGPDPGERGGT